MNECGVTNGEIVFKKELEIVLVSDLDEIDRVKQMRRTDYVRTVFY